MVKNEQQLFNETGKPDLVSGAYSKGVEIYKRIKNESFDGGNNKQDMVRREYHKGMEIITKIHGKDTIPAYLTLGTLGIVCIGQGEFIIAEKFYAKALRIGRKLFSLDDVRICAVVHGLCLVYTSQGKYRESESLTKKSLSLCRKASGKKGDIVSLSILVTWGEMVLIQRRHEEAKSLFSEALIYAKEEKCHEKEYTISYYLGVIHNYQENYSQAIICLISCIKIRAVYPFLFGYHDFSLYLCLAKSYIGLNHYLTAEQVILAALSLPTTVDNRLGDFHTVDNSIEIASLNCLLEMSQTYNRIVRNKNGEFVCFGCQKTNLKMPHCSRCKTARYCSSKCQKEQWFIHKVICRDIDDKQ